MSLEKVAGHQQLRQRQRIAASTVDLSGLFGQVAGSQSEVLIDGILHPFSLVVRD